MEIKLSKNDKLYIEGTDDVYSIMQRLLLRDNKIDRKKEHFWIIGMIQVGRILNIELVDYLIISPISYLSFRSIELMDELEKSLKYVPTYQIIEQIRKEERKIAKEKLAIERDKTKSAQIKAKEVKEKADFEKKILINALLDKDVPIETIAKILNVKIEEIKKLINK